jgi:hypothetical protein
VEIQNGHKKAVFGLMFDVTVTNHHDGHRISSIVIILVKNVAMYLDVQYG